MELIDALVREVIMNGAEKDNCYRVRLVKR